MRPAHLLILLLPTVMAGCFSLSDTRTYDAPPINTAKTAAISQAKQKAKTNKPSANLPETLGGVLASDSWVIYKEKEEEEFTGHVHYDNGQYIFRADYALSQRKLHRITARGQVYLRDNEPGGVWYELQADEAYYDYQTQSGTATALNTRHIVLTYHTAKNDLFSATAARVDIDARNQIYHLIGAVTVIHTDPKGRKTTLTAKRIDLNRRDNYALLYGEAKVNNASGSLQADQIVYDGGQGFSRAEGGRPLAQGTTPDGTFAIIADEMSVQNDSHKIKLSGQVQGWMISPKLKESGLNKNF